jgi:hypothetical protein
MTSFSTTYTKEGLKERKRGGEEGRELCCPIALRERKWLRGVKA